MSLLADIKFIIIGGGGHARVVADILNLLGAEILGYVDNHQTDLPHHYLGQEDRCQHLENTHLAMGIGGATSTEIRRKISEKYPKQLFLPLIHPRAIIGEGVFLDYGVQVMAGAIIEANSKVGYGTIVNSGAIINHDCQIGEFCHIAPGANICGMCSVGDNAIIGPSAILGVGCTIEPDNIIRAGQICLHDGGKTKIINR